jgi:hypothetical protein
MGFFEIGSHEVFTQGCLRTLILLIAASWIAKITGMSHWCLTIIWFFNPESLCFFFYVSLHHFPFQIPQISCLLYSLNIPLPIRSLHLCPPSTLATIYCYPEDAISPFTQLSSLCSLPSGLICTPKRSSQKCKIIRPPFILESCNNSLLSRSRQNYLIWPACLSMPGL